MTAKEALIRLGVWAEIAAVNAEHTVIGEVQEAERVLEKFIEEWEA